VWDHVAVVPRAHMHMCTQVCVCVYTHVCVFILTFALPFITPHLTHTGA